MVTQISLDQIQHRIASPRCPTPPPPPPPHVIIMKWRRLVAGVLDSYAGLGKASIVQGTTAQIIEKVTAPQHSTLPDNVRLIMVEHSYAVPDDIVIFSTQESNSVVGLHSWICGLLQISNLSLASW